MEKKTERGLKKLDDGRWRYSWKYRGKYHRMVAPNKTVARQNLEKIRTQIAEGRYLEKEDKPETPFNVALKRFVEWSNVNTRPSTSRNDAFYSALWLASPHFAGKTLDQVTPAAIEGYKADRVQIVSKKTVDNDLARLKRMFNLCKTWNLCKGNPVEAVKFFKPESRRDRFLSYEEEALLVEKAPPLLKPAILFSLNTGLRLGEMLSLAWGQVDLKRGFVTITAENAKGKRTRRVPLNEQARKALESLPSGLGQGALVFPYFDGRQFGPFQNMWRKAVQGSGLVGVCWHTLRHTFASRLVMGGVDLVSVQKLLGHTTLAMVLKYSHLSETHLQDAVHVLDSKLHLSCTREDAPETRGYPSFP